jgi:signal transduction histidine kinase
MNETLTMLRRLERAHRCLSRCSRLIVRGLGEPELVQAMCDLAVQEAGYRLAWVGYVDRDEARRVRPVAQSGYEDGYLDRIEVSWGDDALGRGPTGTAIREGRAVVAQQLRTEPAYEAWREQALQRGYEASVALPLRDGDVVFGALNLYASEPDAFDAAERELLEEMADDLAHGIAHARGKEKLSLLEEALRRSERLDAVGRVAASLAHDINNLLTVILGTTDQIAAAPSGENVFRYVTIIHEAVSRAAKLNDDLLCFARRAPEQPTVFAVDPALSRLLAILEHGVHLPLVFESAASDGQIRMDLENFERIVTNLIMNAQDATQGDGAITIATALVEIQYPVPGKFSELPPGQYVSVVVRDTGAGMDPDVMRRIFEPFFTTKGAAGTGLGLPTSFGLVRQAGGAIAVESEVGVGSVFEVLLPRCGG